MISAQHTFKGNYQKIIAGMISMFVMAMVISPQLTAALPVPGLNGGLSDESEPQNNRNTTSPSPARNNSGPAEEREGQDEQEEETAPAKAPSPAPAQEKKAEVPVVSNPTSPTSLPAQNTIRVNPTSQRESGRNSNNNVASRSSSDDEQRAQASSGTPVQAQTQSPVRTMDVLNMSIFRARSDGAPITYSSIALTGQQTTYGYIAAALLLLAGATLYSITHYSKRTSQSKRSIRISTLAYK